MALRSVIIGGLHIQDHEFFYPLYRLREEQADIDVATPGGEDTVSNKGSTIKATKAIERLSVEDYDLLVIPGGAHAMEYLRQDKNLIRFVSEYGNSGRVIASICQGAQLLISARLVEGKTVAGYYSLQDDLENAGAIYKDQPAVQDQNIVSTAHYKDMGPWLKVAIAAARSSQSSPA